MPCGLTLGSWLLDDGRSLVVSACAIYCSIHHICHQFSSSNDIFGSVVFIWFDSGDTKRWHPADYCIQTDYSCKGPLLSTLSMLYSMKAKAPQF